MRVAMTRIRGMFNLCALLLILDIVAGSSAGIQVVTNISMTTVAIERSGSSNQTFVATYTTDKEQELPCKRPSNATAIITWSYENDELYRWTGRKVRDLRTTGAYTNVDYNISASDFSLIIRNVTRDNAGAYRCDAGTARMGTYFGADYDVSVQVLPTLVTIECHPTNACPAPGRTIRSELRCTCTAGEVNPENLRLEWIGTAVENHEGTQRTEVGEELYELTSAAKVEPTSGDNNVSCRVAGYGARDEISHLDPDPTIAIQVLSPPQCTISFTIDDECTTAVVSCDCNAGYPEAANYLFYDGKNVVIHGRQSNTHTTLLSTLAEDDQVTFKCRGCNGVNYGSVATLTKSCTRTSTQLPVKKFTDNDRKGATTRPLDIVSTENGSEEATGRDSDLSTVGNDKRTSTDATAKVSDSSTVGNDEQNNMEDPGIRRSTGLIIGCVVGIVVLLILVACLVWYIFLKDDTGKSKSEGENASQNRVHQHPPAPTPEISANEEVNNEKETKNRRLQDPAPTPEIPAYGVINKKKTIENHALQDPRVATPEMPAYGVVNKKKTAGNHGHQDPGVPTTEIPAYGVVNKRRKNPNPKDAPNLELQYADLDHSDAPGSDKIHQPEDETTTYAEVRQAEDVV